MPDIDLGPPADGGVDRRTQSARLPGIEQYTLPAVEALAEGKLS